MTARLGVDVSGRLQPVDAADASSLRFVLRLSVVGPPSAKPCLRLSSRALRIMALQPEWVYRTGRWIHAGGAARSDEREGWRFRVHVPIPWRRDLATSRRVTVRLYAPNDVGEGHPTIPALVMSSGRLALRRHARGPTARGGGDRAPPIPRALIGYLACSPPRRQSAVAG